MARRDTNVVIRKVLVVLEAGQDDVRAPTRSPLLTRAVELAGATACELELFQVVYAAPAERSVLPIDGRGGEEDVAVHAARLTELASWLKPLGLKVRHDVRSGASRLDVIAGKIRDSRCDLVLKGSRRDSHLFGGLSELDGHLLRTSPVPVWVTRHAHRPVSAVTVGVRGHLKRRSMAADDQQAIRWAAAIARPFGAKLLVVHGCTSGRSRRCREIAQALRQQGGICEVVVTEQDTLASLPNTTMVSRSALVVIGVHDVPCFTPVAAPASPLEPVLAQIPCDVMVVNERSPLSRTGFEGEAATHESRLGSASQPVA